MAHVIEVGAVNSLTSDWQFTVTASGNTVNDNEYYHQYDEFTIELVDTDTSASS